MRLTTRFLSVGLALGGLAVLFTSGPALAQGTSGFSEYFVLGNEDHVWRAMDRVRQGEAGGAFVGGVARMNSVVSITATAANQVVYYDQWEDGFETGITSAGQVVTQSTTLVLGDGNLANGKVCDWSTDPRVYPCTGVATHDDILRPGTPMTLASDMGVAGICAAPYLPPPSQVQIACSLPVRPGVASITRVGTTATVTTAIAHGWQVGQQVTVTGATNSTLYNGTFAIATVPSTTTFTYTMSGTPAVSPAASTTGGLVVNSPVIRFDGGDRVFNVGGSLSTAHIEDPGSPLVGGGTELLSRGLVEGAVAYSIPIGENLAPGANNGYTSAKYTSLDIVAFDDNTSVTVNSPGAGSRSLTLHRGQHYSTCVSFTVGTAGAGNSSGTCTAGAIDGPPPPSGPDNRGVFTALALRTNGGTKISTTGPLNALIFTGGHGTYQTRHYATLPDILHATDYVTTAPGDAVLSGGVNQNLNLFIYNPDPSSTINVTRTDNSGSSTFAIGPNAVVDYRSVVGAFVPGGATVRLTSSNPFWGLSAYDATASAMDWGHAWLGVRFLSDDYTLAYSPGTQFIPVTSITHAGGVATVTTGINHILTNGSSIRLIGVSMPSIPITSLTRVGTTVTATSAGHGLAVGTLVTISGATATAPNTYNGTFAITAVTANTFTYTASATPGSSPAGGTITASWDFNGVRTIASVPTATTFTFALAGGAPGSASGGTVNGLCDGSAAIANCNSYNRDPVFVAGTQNNTQVKIDLNADGVWDFIDTDSDNCPDSGNIVAAAGICETPPVVAGCTAPTANTCVYVVNAPGTGAASQQSLHVYDYTDFRNRGTHIQATHPVAVSWGEDTDQGQGGDPSPDNGYTVYPAITVNPVVSLEKSVSPSRVPLAGGQATYSVRIYSGQYGPITQIKPRDKLPAGIACSDYVPGSTLITYPDLSTSSADPTCTNSIITSLTSVGATATAVSANHALTVGDQVTIAGATSTAPNNYNGTFVVASVINANTFTYTMTAASGSTTAGGTITIDGGRSRLSWTLVQASLAGNQQTVISYKVSIPAAPGGLTRSLENEAEVRANLGGSIFRPKDTALLNQSDLTISKAVTHDGTPEVGDILTYTVAVRNGGAVETNVNVTDAIPPFTSFVAGSINLAVPVTSITQASGTATVTMPVAHNYVTGATVTIAGATGATTAYNGAKVITVTSPTTFTFTVAGGTPSPATGTITATPSSGVLTGAYSAGANAVTWAGTPLAANAVAILTFQVQINQNTATGSVIPNFANYSSASTSSADSNTVTTTVVGPALAISKSGPAGPLHPNEIATLELLVQNTGSGFARNLVISDNVTGGNLTYVPGSMSWSLNAGAFVALTDAVDADQANVTGTQITFAPGRSISSLTRVGTVATATTLTPHGWLSGQTVTVAGATSDPALWNGSYVITVTGANTFTYTMSGTPAASPAAGTITADTPLAPGSSLRLRFQTQVDAGTGGLFAANQAQVTGAGQPVINSNLYQVPIVGDAIVTGHVFLDLDGSGVQSAGTEPNLPNVTVTITDSLGGVQTITTDALGNYSVVVPAGATTVAVNSLDPDIPSGSHVSTPSPACVSPFNSPPCNATQSVTAVAGVTTASAAVGYQPPPVSISKVSSGGGAAVPGQVLTYTVTVTNNTGATQTGVTLTDSVPANTTYVDNTAQVTYSTPNPFRVTEYFLGTSGSDLRCGGAAFTGASCTLTLNQNLASDFFVMVQGGDGLDNDTARTPNQNYASLTAAGAAAKGQLAAATANTLVLTRGGASSGGSAWVGVVTVVECLSDCAVNGFRLLDVRRILHEDLPGGGNNPVLTGTATAGTAWTDLSRVLLVGGNNGAGCDTAETNNGNNPVCWAKFVPSGTNTITWTRSAVDNNNFDATSTVMVVQWGSAWTVNERNVAGNAGNTGADAANEYDHSAAFTAVNRANTWVWGSGTTTDDGVGDGVEGALITLGDGAAQNATETQVSVGLQNGQQKDFEVWAMTHPQLAVDYRFKATGDQNASAVNQTVNAATDATKRMALVFNGMDNTDTNFSRPMFSARYTTSTNVELRRRRTNRSFASWTQGIDFAAFGGSAMVVCNGNNAGANQCSEPADNANVLVPANGITLPSGGSITLTYQVTVNSPLASGVTQITNTAIFTSTQTGAASACPGGFGICASAVDAVVRPAVRVEPNNSGFAAVPTTPAGTQVSFTQGVTNLGTSTDAFTLSLRSEIPSTWKLELIDPATLNVIATDTNGDGIWDGSVTISTGPLAVGETKNYVIRATVPFGTAAGTQNTVELQATSGLSSLVKDVGTSEITALPAGTFGPVVLLPDHSGIVAAGETIAYTHRLFNNTGAAEFFDLRADTTLTPAWPTTIYADTNGDGVYTPGVDLALPDSPTTGFKTTGLLPNGGSLVLFVVTMAPLGTAAGAEDVAHLTARSRSNPVLTDAVTDTTTILAATTHDLTGGGTRMASAGDLTVFPGTLYNLKSTADRFDFTMTASSLFGVDGYNHPTELWVDTNSDGVPETKIAVDLNGDGTWDQLCGAGIVPACSAANFNNNANGLPDILVPGNGSVAYELRRAIDPNENIWKEYATLTATSFSTSEKDSVTAQWIISALSRASIRGLRVDPLGVVEFVTGTQQHTASFNLYQTDDRSLEGERTLLNSSPVLSPAPDSLLPILYRVETSAVQGRYLLIEETETTGNVLTYGPYSTVNTRLRRGLERVEATMDRLGVPAGPVRVSRQSRDRVPGRGARARVQPKIRKGKSASNGVVIETVGEGSIAVPLAQLQEAGLPAPTPKKASLSRGGLAIPFTVTTVAGEPSLLFQAAPLSTDYSDKAPYVLTWPGTYPAYAPTAPLTSSADPQRPGYTRIERNSIFAGSTPQGADPWQWDLMFGDGSVWPYPWWDPGLGRFDLPTLGPLSYASVPVKIRLVGVSDDRHVIGARINGFDVGSVTFDGVRTALLEGSVPRSVLRPSDNELTLIYSAYHADGSSAPAGFVYLDYLDLAMPVAPAASTAALDGARSYDPSLPSFAGIQYLIVTHPQFREQADRLADLKSRLDGFKTAVVETDNVYDRYSGGVQEPQAIAAVIRQAAQTSPRLKYVVLFGDDALDPRNYLGGGMVSYIPSIMGRDTSSRIANENAYADVNGDGVPDLAIGRLPVTTVEEGAAVVDKIEAQTATLTASGGVHVFVSDDSRTSDAQFAENAREMSQLLPASATSVLADVSGGVGQARQALFGAWRHGSTMTHYFGHGGPEIWTDEALFSVEDVEDLQGTMSPMVLLAWACQSQYYQNYYGPSVNEALFLSPRSGSLASFGPVGITSPEHQRALYERVYSSLYEEGVSLGEIIRRAKVAALTANPRNQDVVDGFMFFGDPSLRLPRP